MHATLPLAYSESLTARERSGRKERDMGLRIRVLAGCFAVGAAAVVLTGTAAHAAVRSAAGGYGGQCQCSTPPPTPAPTCTRQQQQQQPAAQWSPPTQSWGTTGQSWG